MIYETIFDAASTGFRGWWFPAIGLFFIAISALAVFARTAMQQPMPRAIKPAHGRALKIFGFAFSIFWTVAAAAITIPNHLTLQNASASNDCLIAEGVVANFLPAEDGGRKQESFTVSGVPFAYSEYAISSGFNQTQPRGGPIRDGLQVRICYSPWLENAIARLEIAQPA
jgi:hypothetical protein